jgi:hypothetical protein
MSTYEQFLGLKARGSSAGSTDPGLPPLAVRKDTAADLSGGDGKYAPPQLDANGNLRVIDEAVKGFVDGLETLLGTTNSSLSTLNSAITTLQGYVDQIEGYTDGIETLITSTNTKLDTLHTDNAAATPVGSNVIGKVSIDQATPGTTDSVSIKSQGYGVAVSLTRTADTNAYAAGDVIGSATGSTAALTFSNIGPSGGGEIMITSAVLEIDASAVISGETSYELRLYNVTPPSALGDNAAWDLGSGDRASYLGKIALGTIADVGSTLLVETDSINKQITLAGANLYGYLVTVGTYTPTSARVHKITLHSVRI